MKRIIFILGLLLSTSLIASTFGIDKSHSNVGFKVKHMMISTVTGSLDKFTAEIEYDTKTNKFTKLKGIVDVNSINTDNEKRDGHLKSPDFFDVAKYPNIVFEMTKQSGDKIYGKLTMHGVTKDVVLNLDLGGVIEDPWGNTRLGFSLSGSVDRTEYGVLWNKTLDKGGLTVGNDVKLIIDIEAIAE